MKNQANQVTEGYLEPHKENVQRKTAAKVYKGPPTRYGQQAELKDQNKLLLASNEELKNNLKESQQTVTGLELQLNDLKKENADIQKSLKDCHVLLVAGKIDPVLGDAIAEPCENQRKEVMNISRDLLKELRDFTDISSNQLDQLQVSESVGSYQILSLINCHICNLIGICRVVHVNRHDLHEGCPNVFPLNNF